VLDSPMYPSDSVTEGYQTVGGWDDKTGGREESVGDDASSFSVYNDAPRYNDAGMTQDYLAMDDLLAGKEDVGKPLSFTTNDQPMIDRGNVTALHSDVASANGGAHPIRRGTPPPIRPMCPCSNSIPKHPCS
jgi:hypothetical protein